MTPTLPPLGDPERQLAISYAPAAARSALHALWALDERLGALAVAGREPQLRLMRLLWWHDALTRLDTAPAPAEPLLQAIAAALPPRGVTGGALAELEEGWSALAEDEGAVAEHAALRGERLFALAAAALGAGGAPVEAAGRLWALVDRARAMPPGGERERVFALARAVELPRRRWPPGLRALGLLTVLAQADARAREASAAGSPRRLLRAIGHRLTGW